MKAFIYKKDGGSSDPFLDGEEVSLTSNESKTKGFDSGAPFNFSACLLIKDDNKILPEWLAYHYEVLPLRRLIVGVDPLRSTDPTPILDAYRSIGMNITVWEEDVYFRNGGKWWMRSMPRNASAHDIHKAHRWRQPLFLTQCLKQLKSENRSWTMLVDTDEYLVYNPYREDEGMPWHCAEMGKGKRSNKTAAAECSMAYHLEMQKGESPRTRLPVIGTPNSTLAHYLASRMAEVIAWDPLYSRPCMVVPRNLFGALESENNDAVARQYVPNGLNISWYRTLRFRKHGCWQNELPGKPVVDVSAYDPFQHQVLNPHMIGSKKEKLCNGGPYVKSYSRIFRVHHFTGTKEEFLSRPGRQLQNFEKRNQIDVIGEASETLPWLNSFVARFGVDRTYELTEGLRKWAFETDSEALGDGLVPEWDELQDANTPARA